MRLSAAVKAGLAVPGKPGRRRPRPISSGPKRGRPTRRRVTDPTSRAAITRSIRRRGSSGRRSQWGPVRGRTTRGINTGSRRRSPMRKGRCK